MEIPDAKVVDLMRVPGQIRAGPRRPKHEFDHVAWSRCFGATGNLDSTKLHIIEIVARHESVPERWREILAFEYPRKSGRRCHYGLSLSRRCERGCLDPALCPSSRTFLRDPAMWKEQGRDLPWTAGQPPRPEAATHACKSPPHPCRALSDRSMRLSYEVLPALLGTYFEASRDQ